MMEIRYIFYFSLFTILFSYQDNPSLLSEMFENSDWIRVNSHSDSLIVYKKKIDGVSIPAFKATMLSSVPMDYVISAILDGENHEKFMGTSHVVESEFIGDNSSDTTFVYQMLDLPIISDRHYITKNYTDTVRIGSHYRLNWMINSNENELLFSDFISDKNSKYGSPIFMKDGAGSWEVKEIDENRISVSYIVLTDPGGWIPNQIVSYVNKKLGPETVLMMVEEGRRRYEKDRSK